MELESTDNEVTNDKPAETNHNDEEQSAAADKGDIETEPSTEIPPEEMPIVKLCQHVWAFIEPDDEDCVDGMQMREYMSMSQLPTETLGLIWSMVDVDQRGKVCFFLSVLT